MTFDFDIQERMNLQRKILKKINSTCPYKFTLNGLSQSAIETWEKHNGNIPNELISSIKNLSDCLLTLSTKSQESIDIQDINLKKLKLYLSKLDNFLLEIS